MNKTSQRRIIFTDPARPYLEQHLLKLGYICDDFTQASRAEILEALPRYFGAIVRSRLQVDQEFLTTGAALQFVARIGVGVEHIDLDFAAEKNIQVITSPEGSRDAVGEHAMGLLLMLMNNLARADREIRAGQWNRHSNRGYEIKGKTVGIVGYGNMGGAFAKKLQGFDCEVIAYDKFKSGYSDIFAKEVDLATFQAQADIISLHIPYLTENYHFVNDDFLSGFAKNIWVVNTARGLVLNTADLVKGLNSGKVLGAALDVIEFEDASFDHLDPSSQPAEFKALLAMPNVVLNPHIGGWSHEAADGHAKVLAHKIETQFGEVVKL